MSIAERVPHGGAPGRADIQPVAHESLDRTLTGLVTALPFVALGVAAWRSWNRLLQTSDLLVAGFLCVLTGLGVTVPASARHGLGPRQVDPSALVTRVLEACGLAWDVVRVSPERQARKLARRPPAPAS